jgi:cobalt-zinc-cadmium efflux system membrane fusion protein
VTTPHETNPLGAAVPTATRPRGKRGIVGVIAVAALVVGSLAIGLRRGAPEVREPPRDVPTFDGKWIRYSPGFAERAGLTFANVETGSLSPLVNVTGTVTFDPERVAVIGARIPGRLTKILKFPGDHVDAGEALGELQSADLGHAEAALLAARAHAEAAAANEARETQLAEIKVSAKRDAELARAAAAAAKADLLAAEQRVGARGGGRGGQVGVLRLTSPIAGKLIESHVSLGQSVEPSATLFRVADLSRVWVVLAVFERELPHLREGDAVEISPQTNLSLVQKGTVAHVGDVINLETRSAEVRVVAPNPDTLLRPGQSVSARVHTRTTPAQGFLVPRDAITTIDGKPTVFVIHDEGKVEPRTVVAGARDGARVEVTSGLAAGDRVATKGVFALKSEIFR